MYKILVKINRVHLQPFQLDLIYSLTGFVHHRCILDKIFLFPLGTGVGAGFSPPFGFFSILRRQVIEWTEKFWRGHSRFSKSWIRDVSALYSSASSAMTIGNHIGWCFQLSTSVCQSCPFASCYFLFMAQTIIISRGQNPFITRLTLTSCW